MPPPSDIARGSPDSEAERPEADEGDQDPSMPGLADIPDDSTPKDDSPAADQNDDEDLPPTSPKFKDSDEDGPKQHTEEPGFDGD